MYANYLFKKSSLSVQICEITDRIFTFQISDLKFLAGHANLQLSSSYPGGLRYFFWHFFKKISEFFSKSLKRILKISKSEYACLYVYKQITFMSNFSSLAFTQTDLGKFLTFFQENFRIFLRKFQNFEILKKVLIRATQKVSFSKISAHLVVLKKIQKKIQNFLTPEFSQEISKFQNSEYEVHQSSTND